ncbi:Crocetin glucosyltransferase [Nymphaea thermarum]|nr:Crocetin glucosyltransferase [Nymphaea thermarum]
MAPHIMVVAFPAQGHINPILQLAKLLASRGVLTTFVTTTHAHKLISRSAAAATTITGLSFASISDGYDSSVETTTPDYPQNLNRHAPSSLTSLVRSLAASGQPVDCIAYNFLLTWAADVASSLGVPSALLWIQPASVLSIFYHFVEQSPHLFGDISGDIHLAGLPSLHAHDLPTFLLPEDVLYHAVCHNLSSMFRVIKDSKTKWVLVNSFDALEPEAISQMRSIFPGVAAVGPLIPSAFTDAKDPKDTSFGGDLLNQQHSNNGCTTPERSVLEWLDSKPEGSVLYISFGTWAKLAAAQLDEVC